LGKDWSNPEPVIAPAAASGPPVGDDHDWTGTPPGGDDHDWTSPPADGLPAVGILAAHDAEADHAPAAETATDDTAADVTATDDTAADGITDDDAAADSDDAGTLAAADGIADDEAAAEDLTAVGVSADDAEQAPAAGDEEDGETAEPVDAGAPAALAVLGEGEAHSGELVEATQRKPGDLAETQIAVWSEEAALRFREDWHLIKANFVDDPVAAVAQAQALVASAVHALGERLLAEQVDLDPRRQSDAPDTEALRVAMRQYRDFLDRVLSL
jgi:hypothetical protein